MHTGNYLIEKLTQNYHYYINFRYKILESTFFSTLRGIHSITMKAYFIEYKCKDGESSM